MAHRTPFAFEVGEMHYREDAFRFLNGTPHIPCLYAARPGLELIGRAGVGAIRAKSMRQTERLIDLAHASGFQVTAPGDAAERGGTVAVRCDHAYEVSRELLRREVLVDYRPGSGIRISPHFYTADSELERVIREMSSILDSGAWRFHSGARQFVT
jgi:kynureninase